jgi:hypothetical protein
MTHKLFAGAAFAAALSVSAPALAGWSYGTGFPVIVPDDNTIVSLQYIYTASTNRNGDLYFLGSGSVNAVSDPAPGGALGQFCFNRVNTPFDTIVLLGEFDEGDVLHFAYDITEPAPSAFELFRTDVLADKPYFAWDEGNAFVAIEDTREPGSDLDFNDFLFCVIFEPVPGPGALTALMLGLAAAPLRRRRAA